ncbi:MAG: cytochrome P450 [Actinobacteria bacterium]|nr:cytochrome P450 [Actinomycetota bacterium]
MIPVYDADLFTDEALTDPYDVYRTLRDLGPVVRLTAHDVYAVTRYADVRTVLEDPEAFCSRRGVGFNDLINDAGRGTTLMSDGEQHERLREVIGRPLTPKALAEVRPDAQALADRLADELALRGSFDAVCDLAEVLPATWVPDLLGWPQEGRDRLIEWGAANFDALGPANARAEAAGAGVVEMAAYAHHLAESPLPKGSMAAGILEAAARGDIAVEQCPFAIIDYLGPSLDTTVSALGNAIWLFATHPDQWQLLRREPDRVKHAFNEVLRIETPISAFTRVTTRPATIGGVELPAGARVMVSYASANRDERRWDDPDTFDITRNSAAHIAFGYGDHACAGMGLARLEGAAVLGALVERIEHFELSGPPVRKLNNLIRSFASLPVTVRVSAPTDRAGVPPSDSPASWPPPLT